MLRVLVLVPAVLLLPIRTDATGRKSLDCHRLIKHINDVQVIIVIFIIIILLMSNELWTHGLFCVTEEVM